MTRSPKFLLLAALAVAGLSRAALAGSVAQTQTVNATITGNCVLTANSAGPSWAYDPVGANVSAAVLQTLTWTYLCTSGFTPVSTALDQGANPTAGSTAVAPARQMINGANKLAYNIFSSAANRTTGTAAVAWGTAVGPTLVAGTGAAQTFTLYVSIPGGQNLPALAYTDTITETLNF
jgi:spore coat protein U-like protein